MNKTALKTKLQTLLSSDRKITFEWDCGGDETLIDVFENKKRASRATWIEPLCDVVAKVLELPNAGEYFVKGTGELHVKGEDIYIRHKSTASGIDYNFPKGLDLSTLDEDDFEEYMVEFEDQPIKGDVKLL
jgi:hypothetical protein